MFGVTGVLARLRRRLPGLPPADALLLLPRAARSAAVVAAPAAWSDALHHWGFARAPAAESELLITADAATAADLRRPMVLLTRPDRRRRLPRAGYSVLRYRVRRMSGTVLVVAPDRGGLRAARRTWAPRGAAGRPRPALLLARAVVPRGGVTVAALEGGLLPAPVRAAGLASAPAGTGVSVAVDAGDVRRRAVALVSAGRDGEQLVVKMQRSPRQQDRGAGEQRLLAAMPDDGVAPRPRGAGRVGPVPWSAETVRAGLPLARLVRRGPAAAEPVLDRLAGWLGDLAVASASERDWSSASQDDSVVTLRGPALMLRPVLDELPGVPGVVVHGDLASGTNVVVDPSGRPGVLDWETARSSGLPLLDLLPTLSTSMARAVAGPDLIAQADEVLAMATGRSVRAGWLLGHVAGYARRLGLSPEVTGRLALLAWGHQSSMRLARDEQLVAAGQPTAAWTSLAEVVLDRWCDEVRPDWPALVEQVEGRG